MLAKKALVLAAGMGTRLADAHEAPKPLVQVMGVPMIYRTMDSLRKGGVEELGVVIGYKGEEVRAAVEYYALREGLDIQFVINDRWQEPNGLSLYMGREFSREEDFILSMVDHLFDPRIIELLQAVDRRHGVTLAVDEQIGRIFDLDDATKVLKDERARIRNIGKQIPEYNAIDCGLFRCTAEIFPALEEAFADEAYSISDGMQILAAHDRFYAEPVGGLFWQDMDTPHMLAEAERMVRLTQGREVELHP